MLIVHLNSAPRPNSKKYPPGDICKAHPSQGIALETEFHVRCKEDGFIDEDIPLLYQYFYMVQGQWKMLTYPTDGKTLIFSSFLLPLC